MARARTKRTKPKTPKRRPEQKELYLPEEVQEAADKWRGERSFSAYVSALIMKDAARHERREAKER